MRPVQIDGMDAIGRAPWGSSVETFAGLPVVPRFGPRSYDWLVGGRIAQTFASTAVLGVSYVQRREDGEISDEELGADCAVAAASWLDLAVFGSYDLANPGITEARASAAARWQDWRLELFASQLSPGRLLPATSLFSVLGDMPSQTGGATLRWRAAPRLDLLTSGAAQDVSGTLGGNGWLRASLRLDNQGTGSLGTEVRRVDLPGAEWTGLRAIGSLPLGRGFRYSSEVEVVVPDHPDGRRRGHGDCRPCRGGRATDGRWPRLWRRHRLLFVATRPTRSFAYRVRLANPPRIRGGVEATKRREDCPDAVHASIGRIGGLRGRPRDPTRPPLAPI